MSEPRDQVYLRLLAENPRFWQNVSFHDGEDDCWEWTAGRSYGDDVRGCCRFRGERMAAHRAAYIMGKGDIPAGMVIRHSCDNPICVRPDHLSVGTHADNVADRVARGRSAVGSRNGRAKLTEDDVRKIRQELVKGVSRAALARLYSVDNAVIRQIDLGKTWKCVR